MATWQRCPKSPFYRRLGREHYDKRLETFDRVYVDPVDYVVVRTIPWREDSVEVLWWQVSEISQQAYDELREDQAKLLESWAARVRGAWDAGQEISKHQKDALFGDLDIDLVERDRLLDAVEFFVNVSPPEATNFLEIKVPRTPYAVSGVLFNLGVGPC